MKWELREGAMSLMSLSMTLNGSESVDKNRLLQSFFSSSINLVSFLNISLICGLVSEMNSNIIIKEIIDLVDYIRQQSINSASQTGFILSDTFFATDTPPIINKGEPISYKNNEVKPNKALVVKDKKDSRKNAILSILKKNSHLTIKDFVKVIVDCSEKTIQRELIDLVEKGIVKKEGERRWSTYSLTS
jgi:predicted transcriptional regulator